MTNEDESLRLVFNGEIYNFNELRAELEACGHTFMSRTDSETLLHGYEEWHEELPRRLDGMFAFAIWDASGKRLFMARDRFGEKPLYYSRQGDALWFASTVEALAPELPRLSLRPHALDHFMRFRYVPAHLCIYEQIDPLPPAHSLTFTRGQCRISSYWGANDLPDAATIRRLDDALDAVEESLDKSVRNRLAADVPLGVFLSGGVDSTAVASACVKARPDLKAYHVRIPDNDEYPHAMGVAEQLGIALHTDAVSELSWSLMEDVHGRAGEPFADPAAVANHMVAGLARKHVTVILSGDGGDEIFGGGYGETKRECRHALLRSIMPRFARAMLARITTPGGGRPAYVLRQSLLDIPERYRAKHDRLSQLNRNPYSNNVLQSLDSWDALEVYSSAFHELPCDDAIRQIMWADIRTRLAGEYLVKVDRTSMAHGLEVRCPFLSVAVVNTAFSIDSHLHATARDSKILLKLLVARDVDRKHVYRVKQGFDFKIARSLAGPWAEHARSTICASAEQMSEWFDPSFLALIASNPWLDSATVEIGWRLVCFALWLRNAPGNLSL